MLIPIQDPESLLRRLVNQKGPIEGYGIEFIFRDPAPSFLFVMPIENDDRDGENDEEDGVGNRPSSITMIEFDSYHFHRDSMTFRGRVSFADRPVRGNADDGYRYDALECAVGGDLPSPSSLAASSSSFDDIRQIGHVSTASSSSSSSSSSLSFAIFVFDLVFCGYA